MQCASLPFLGLIELLLVMSVNPGWGGPPFVAGSMEKLADAKAARRGRLLHDRGGGIKTHNVAAAVDVLVAGSAVFASRDYAATIRPRAARRLRRPRLRGLRSLPVRKGLQLTYVVSFRPAGRVPRSEGRGDGPPALRVGPVSNRCGTC
jgi:hypothetical protein